MEASHHQRAGLGPWATVGTMGKDMQHACRPLGGTDRARRGTITGTARGSGMCHAHRGRERYFAGYRYGTVKRDDGQRTLKELTA